MGGLIRVFMVLGLAHFLKLLGFLTFISEIKKLLGCSGPKKYRASFIYTNLLESHLPTISGTWLDLQFYYLFFIINIFKLLSSQYIYIYIVCARFPATGLTLFLCSQFTYFIGLMSILQWIALI